MKKNNDETFFRMEVIANQSVKEELIDVLEGTITDILYTLIPTVHGHGDGDYKLGNTTWPESNFILISYIKESQVEFFKAAVQDLKKRFPTEGIKVFAIKSEKI